jgi:hypothetical protein
MTSNSEQLAQLLQELLTKNSTCEDLIPVLNVLFPKELRGALELLAHHSVELHDSHGCLEVNLSIHSSKVTCILPTPYCSCKDFTDKVLSKSASLLCKHLVAAILFQEFNGSL